MRKLLTFLIGFAAVCTISGLLVRDRAQGQEQLSSLTVSDGVSTIHIFPTVNEKAALARPLLDTGPLVYHSGGPIMQSVTTYAIFWVPPKLQNGGSTSMSAHYQLVQRNLLTDYPGHGLDNNNTQYYQIVGGKTTYINNAGGFGGYYVDTAPYPASGCADSATPGNCITDAQIGAEIKKVMSAKGWTGGLTKMFLLFTSSGEGSCFNSSSTSCAYTQYCAYHSFISGTTPIVYGNEPYGDPTNCQVPGTPSPNGDIPADTAATSASHELTEAITDPELNAWYSAQGNEIGDLCAYNYDLNYWDSGNANQKWNGHFYELQDEYNNHDFLAAFGTGCTLIGP